MVYGSYMYIYIFFRFKKPNTPILRYLHFLESILATFYFSSLKFQIAFLLAKREYGITKKIK